MISRNFEKSDMGAQAAWKGFSSQTLYIASRLISDVDGYEYYPEDVEDLIVKKDGVVVEAVQVKNVVTALTISSLAATKTSKGGEGFFNRMCSLHMQNKSFSNIRIVCFGELGTELQEVKDNIDSTKKNLEKRLEDKHGLSATDACWLINSLIFEKANLEELNRNIRLQISSYIPTMPAPELTQDLLIQYISELSNSKGFTTLKMWQEKIHSIGTSIAAIDGFYKEYNKSLVCLRELQLNYSHDQLQNEFSQGVSAHPTHIRLELDFKRDDWLEMVREVLKNKGVAVIKGVSGQGKSTLCYRYLIDTYPEGCVFCVRAIATEEQAQNLVAALDGLGKHNKNLVIYIDVQPGEILWAFLVQELQSRGLEIPVLISIRDEDYNATPINGKAIQYGVVELMLSEEEAEHIYDTITAFQPHSLHRTFEDAWQSFGGKGPLIEFVYLLTNNQTLTQRIHEQIDALLKEGVLDEWLELLQLVCYTGRLGCPVDLNNVKKVIQCSTMQAAIRRLKDEYLIRVVDENRIEALHPVRAQIVFDVLCNQTCTNARDIIFKTLSCVSSRNVRLLLLDYFSHHKYQIEDIEKLSQITFIDWVQFANVIRTMLWLDAKRYVDSNMAYIHSFIERRGKAWLCFLPLDLSGISGTSELIADGMKELPLFNKADLQEAIDEVKNSLTSLSIDYQATDYFFKNCTYPDVLPNVDEERSSFGYALFWMAKRGFEVALSFNASEIATCVWLGELQPSADAIRGLYEHSGLRESYQNAIEIMVDKLISEMSIISYVVTDDVVSCKFVPPVLTEKAIPENAKNTNQYWRIKMLDILKQMYPEKEYIDIELIGVDLLGDLGIKAMDHKLHIHKDKRPNTWVSEVNGWTKNRIDYSLRPATWNQYVLEIDEIRSNVHELILETLKFIDDIYKKGHYTKERWKRVEERLAVFRTHTFAENRLPYFAVDPYCLYSEGNAKSPTAEFFTMHQLLSVGKYEKFRKRLNDVYTSLDNFYNQFAEVLLVRINKQDIAGVEKPKLAMFNLYSAAKALADFQQEYALLFLRYSSLDDSFAKQELESVLTLVNVWRHVLDNAPKGYAIVYDAKQKYRRGTAYFRDTLMKAVVEVNGTLVEAERYAYIAKDYNLSEENTLANEYTSIVLKIRKVFQSAVSYSSDRWYSETQPLELAYVPIISGVYSPVVYSIPFYKLFDAEESCIANPMFPCEIEDILQEKIIIGGAQDTWINVLKKIGEMKLYLQRYSQVLRVPVSENCINSYNSFLESLIKQMRELWREIVPVEEIVNELIKEADEQIVELLNVIQLFLDCYDEIENCIRANGDLNEVIQITETVAGIMIILLPYVTKYSFKHEREETGD